MWIAYQEPEYLASVTKRLYPEVAKRFNTTDKQVERAIRNAIETAWIKGNAETLRAVFEELYIDGAKRPTNTEVIRTFVGLFRSTGTQETVRK